MKQTRIWYVNMLDKFNERRPQAYLDEFKANILSQSTEPGVHNIFVAVEDGLTRMEVV